MKIKSSPYEPFDSEVIKTLLRTFLQNRCCNSEEPLTFVDENFMYSIYTNGFNTCVEVFFNGGGRVCPLIVYTTHGYYL